MPIQRCQVDGKSGYRWGKSGKCYIGKGGRRRAIQQARAIRASQAKRRVISNESRRADGRLRRAIEELQNNIGGSTTTDKNTNGIYRNVERKGKAVGRTSTIRRNTLKLDPTRTATLRRQFSTEMGLRFNLFRKDIVRAVVEEDLLNLRVRNEVTNQFQFLTSSEKVQEFKRWIATHLGLRIIGVTAEQIENAWWRQYVEKGYKKGAGRAFMDTRRVQKAQADTEGKLSFFAGTQAEFLRQSFGQPETVEKLKLLVGRVFTELVGITEQMSQVMTRVLADGLVQGQNPRTVARELTKSLDITRKRAEVIARTELIRAHAEGQLDALERLGVEEVGVAVEWSTAEDARVCPRCAALDGIVLKVEESHGAIPRHPSCRCSFVPANVGEPTKDQIRSKSRIEAAIRKSLKAEKSKKVKTVEEQRKRSSWAGAKRKISKRRPKSIVWYK